MSQGQSEAAVRASERRRIVAALLDALERVGPLGLTEAEIVRGAGVSSEGFHRHFADADACFDFACEAGLDTLLTPMMASWSVGRPPVPRLRDALAALLGSLAAQPRLAQLCLRRSLARQPDRHTYRRAVDAVAELLRDVRPDPGASASGPPVGEEALAEGIVGVIVARLSDDRGEDLEELRPRLLALLLPALGLENGAPGPG